MALLSPTHQVNKKCVRISVSEQLLTEVTHYCEFANIKKPDEFFEKAAEFVLSKDKDYKHHCAALPTD